MRDYKKLTEALREKSELLSTEYCLLFREKFQNYVSKVAKAKQNSEKPAALSIRPST